MEINLTVVFSAVLALAVINTVVFVFLINKIRSLQTNSLTTIGSYSNQLNKNIDDFSQAMKNSFSDLRVEQSEQLEKTMFKLQGEIKELQKQQKASFTELRDEQSEQLKRTMFKLQEEIKEFQIQQKASFTELKNSIEKHSEINTKQSKELTNLISLGFSDSKQQFESREKVLSEFITVKLDENLKLTKQGVFSNNQKHLETFEQLTNQVQMLRIENIVELTNELGKHKKLQVNSNDFIKHLGDCKVVKIEDKTTGQFTQIHYENGIKRSTNTFAGNNLKYQMFFDDTGKAERGIELNDKGEITFEYHYDVAGEINKRVEFNYDDAGKETLRKETNY
ncbi:hypothetical protein [Marinomonas sp. IMCC 4694]|uniref:hypothetical protein n=1 Tax=Marinomonas sp. IMCC 4694 TaxID=2605432 RepID=UPI0011E773ED|nr:hypothetical protein [Marinomonas sp. IMCC 4694]TYL46652.1 hypothetical protein FXV75_01100 [Marinomonas sp. IMCC 4694]